MDSIIFSDISKISWGAHLLEISTGRHWKELARGPRPFKLLGAGSSISGSQSFFASGKGESHPVWPGQLHCSSIHQPAGRYKISAPHSISTRHMVLRTGQEHGDIGNSCSRKWNPIADRMDARSQSVQTNNQASGTPSCGSVCLLDKSSDAGVCVMEARTRGNSKRRFEYPLGFSTELPVSSILLDSNVPKESNAGAGRLHSYCSNMEEPAMVSSTPIHAYPLLLPQGRSILKLPGTDKVHPLCCQKKFQLAT